MCSRLLLTGESTGIQSNVDASVCSILERYATGVYPLLFGCQGLLRAYSVHHSEFTTNITWSLKPNKISASSNDITIQSNEFSNIEDCGVRATKKAETTSSCNITGNNETIVGLRACWWSTIENIYSRTCRKEKTILAAELKTNLIKSHNLSTES